MRTSVDITARGGTTNRANIIWEEFDVAETKDEEGKLELSIRVLGNELIAIKMEVNDFKMKWLVVGVATLIGLGYAVSSFGPDIMNTFGSGM